MPGQATGGPEGIETAAHDAGAHASFPESVEGGAGAAPSGRKKPRGNKGMPDSQRGETALERFIADCRVIAEARPDPADIVVAIAPLMKGLLGGDKAFLRAEHFRSNPDHYTRNAIYIADDESLSLYALVWLPGQWTPVHDHGSHTSA